MTRSSKTSEIPSLLGDESTAVTIVETVDPPMTGRAKGHRVRGGSSVEWARDQAAKALQRRQNSQAATVLQEVLPLWNDEHRGVPNPMIRSGLFGTKATGNRQFIKGEAVASLSNFSIIYKGEELLQDDLSVWMSLLNMARHKRIGDAIFFSGYELVKDLGWRMHSESYDRCKESISRLKANELKVEVKTGTGAYAGSLIREYAWAAETPTGDVKWMVRFEPMIAELFQEDSVTFLAWEQRKKIGSRASLALWLHSYFTSHRDPLPITVQKLHELTKSDEKEIRFFKRRVRNALDRLVEIEFLTTYQFVGDTVHVKKAPLRLGAAVSLKNTVTAQLS
jgi:hypothetical protein